MAQWWEALSVFQQVMFTVASAATIVMIIFLILMMFGASEFGGDVDDPSDVDLNADGINDEPLSAFSGFRVLTLRGALAFLAIGGWTAYGFYTVVGACCPSSSASSPEPSPLFCSPSRSGRR